MNFRQFKRSTIGASDRPLPASLKAQIQTGWSGEIKDGGRPLWNN